MRKLDRVLVNEKWNLNFPLSEARFLPSGMSDHSPMVVKVIGND
jgi:endonuclease/exonuclease/phosphatase family metal-dependent hydrolase